MGKLGILLCVGSASIFWGLAGCSSNDNGGSAAVGGTVAATSGGGANLGGQNGGGTGPQVNVGPPCTPDGPNLTSLPASSTIATPASSWAMQAVTVNGSDVYYLDHNKGVYRITGGSGTPTLIVPAPTDSTVGHTMAGGILKTDGTYVYFAQDKSLYRSSLASPSAELLVAANSAITQVEIDASYVYYIVSTESTLNRIAVTGGSPEVLVASAESVQSLQLVNGTIYFVGFNAEKVGRLPASGGSIEWLTSADMASEAVAVSATTVYFSRWEVLYSQPIGSPNQTTELGSAGPGMPYTADFNAAKLVNDRIYWFDSGDNVGWTKTDGSQCGLLIKSNTSESVRDIAITNDAVYVCLSDSLRKLPR